MTDNTGKTTESIGWILFIGGLSVLTGYAVYEFVMNTQPTFLKLATAAVAAGLVALFVAVLRQRLKASKTDKYKDVEI